MKPFWKVFIQVALALIDAIQSVFGKDDDTLKLNPHEKEKEI